MIRMHLPDTAVCLQCGYSLRGLTEARCPECGGPFDPANPLSWQDPSVLSPMQRRLAAYRLPPPRWEIALACVLTILTWVAVYLLADMARMSELLAPVICIALVILLFRPVMYVLTGDVLPPYVITVCRRDGAQRQRYWWAQPLCALLMVLSLTAGHFIFPSRSPARLHLSRSAMQRKAEAVLTAGRVENQFQWVGLIRFRRIAALVDGQVKFEYAPGEAIMYDPEGVSGRGTWYFKSW